ncbi:hypothetical protein [Lacipirellula parvula]|uniref:Uncharacterized protein n=1 Tax=Lacipirellula parvula TaxID=2650471 RepID=A0A5K7XJ99_9BACT|nr:hypothetical protein [Lacipirellula parvula]BBO34466.1 hypothetical protein PLANPX_4078 [Lacipirellula parvula]
MNPYAYVLSNIPAHQNFEGAALVCILTLMADAYSSGFSRGPGNSEHSYVSRALNTKFGADHLVAKRFVHLFGQYMT